MGAVSKVIIHIEIERDYYATDKDQTFINEMLEHKNSLMKSTTFDYYELKEFTTSIKYRSEKEEYDDRY